MPDTEWAQQLKLKKLKELEDIQAIKKAGYLGVMSSGCIVDRRKYPDAIPMQENKLLGIPAPRLV